MAASQDHDYLVSSYSPSTARPTAVVMARNVQRSSALTFATSQRTAMPVTMKLPPQLPTMPMVPRQSTTTNDRVLLSTCARVREIDPKYKDKKNRPILAYRKDQRYTNETRKRDYAHAVRPSAKPAANPSDSYAAKNSFNTPMLGPSTSAVCRPSTSKLGDNGVRTSTKTITTTTSAAELGGGTWVVGSAQPTIPDEESLVLRVDGDVKMIVDCDPAQPSHVVPKKNRPGRPRKYAEGTKPPRKVEDPDRKRRNRFHRRNDDEQTTLMCEIDERGLDSEDIGYLRTMFGRYQLNPSEDAVVPWGQRIPWMELVVPPTPAMNPQPARLINGAPEPYFTDVDLYDVVPNASGCARAESYDQWAQRRNFLRELEEESEQNSCVKAESEAPTKRRSFIS